jgi:uncharacterized protein YndB with AHSA1/START domain
MTDSIRRELTFPQPPEEVWRALTDSDMLAEWMYPNDFEPRMGHRFTFNVPSNPNFDGIVHCEVLACDAPNELAYSWVGGGVDTHVRYRLEADGAGTRMSFEHSGFESRQAFKGAEYGWTLMHEKLAEVLGSPVSRSPS